jgi:hypothetical protein
LGIAGIGYEASERRTGAALSLQVCSQVDELARATARFKESSGARQVGGVKSPVGQGADFLHADMIFGLITECQRECRLKFARGARHEWVECAAKHHGTALAVECVCVSMMMAP